MEQTTTFLNNPTGEGYSAGGAATSEAADEKFNIMSCLSDIVENSVIPINEGRCRFKQEVFSLCRKQLDYVSSMVGTTPMQTVILASILNDKGCRHLDRKELAKCLGMSYIRFLSFEDDLQTLARMRLINIVNDSLIYTARKTLSVLAANRPFTFPVATGLDTAGVLKEMKEIIDSCEKGENTIDGMLDELDTLFSNNPSAGIVREAKNLGISPDNERLREAERNLFYVLVKKSYHDKMEMVSFAQLDDIFSFIIDCDQDHLQESYYERKMFLQTEKIIEPVNDYGLADPEYFRFTDEVKDKLFAEVGGCLNWRKRRNSIKVVSPDRFPKKELFYNPVEDGQMKRLTGLLSRENFEAMRKRLEESGMRTGVTCLFYGSPGTGKTESVRQLAKATGRGVFEVDVSKLKSCWVGESEVRVSSLFYDYKEAVRSSETAPILLFNEADSIFGIRKEGAVSAVDKMENTLQDIILQEMESIDGILIATTNIAHNLDRAFERRFLYKVKFEKPGTEVKARIWRSMLPDLSEEQARELAVRFDFSGGQIENVSRKKAIRCILDGVDADFSEILGYCAEECICDGDRPARRIGF